MMFQLFFDFNGVNSVKNIYTMFGEYIQSYIYKRRGKISQKLKRESTFLLVTRCDEMFFCKI